MKAKTRHWFIYQQPCFRFHIFAIHLIGVRIMPLAGRDVISSQRTSLQTLFQSTRPLRGATLGGAQNASQAPQFQSTRPLRGATGRDETDRGAAEISIHAPLAGRDRNPRGFRILAVISIHAPLAGRDSRLLYELPAVSAISIHAPLAGRDFILCFPFV